MVDKHKRRLYTRSRQQYTKSRTVVKPLVQFRLSDDEMQMLRDLAEEGESEGLTAKRLLLGVLGVGKKDISQQLSEELKTYIADEIENQTGYKFNSNEDMLKRLQVELKELRNKIEGLQLAEEPKATQAVRNQRRKKKAEEV